ncbi:MAG: type II toxin-antitoxin system RelE/ParE family toxin [Acidobacteria bacterium]|nr:type II toxin-antitoxin system RelE/ParE family toxin [Acidobacteriota bacterium]
MTEEELPPYKLQFSRRAQRYLARLERELQERIASTLRQVAADPYRAGLTKSLKGAAGYRAARVGGLRIVFVVNAKERRVEVDEIAPRGQVYRRLEQR